MTVQEFKRIPVGTKVGWTDGATPKVYSAVGEVVVEKMPIWRGESDPVKHIRWDDHQRTQGLDDAALKYVEVLN